MPLGFYWVVFTLGFTTSDTFLGHLRLMKQGKMAQPVYVMLSLDFATAVLCCSLNLQIGKHGLRLPSIWVLWPTP